MIKVENKTKFLNSLEIQNRLFFAKNYNNWLFGEIERYLGNSLLEVGCALGNFTKKIVNRRSVCAIDIEDEYVDRVKLSFKEFKNLSILKCDISSQDILKLELGRFDTIMCFNVLEHIENDKAAVQNMYKLLTKGGYLCLIVPVFECIFGEMDKTDGHYRRYEKIELIKVLVEEGFNISKSKYINFLGFFGWWFNSRILKRKYIPFFQMLVYDRIIPLMNLIEKLIKLPFGQSLIIIARK